MKKHFDKTDYILWIIIAIYTGIIYATLSLVSKARKVLVEKYGPGVFDYIYWIFAVIGIIFVVYCFRKFRGKILLGKLVILAIFCALYAYYLSGMKYPVEKIHFLEYGLLGVLVFLAIVRHMTHWVSVIISLNIVFWLGIGDEAIQWALPSRVGEIRDSIINLFSGALGIGLLWFLRERSTKKSSINSLHLKCMLSSFGITTILTALFIFRVHGFGTVIETKDPGKVYSSFSASELTKINNQKNVVSLKDRKTYNDEALRHLFQREYFFTNEYVTSTGVTYRLYGQSFFENRILEVYYSRFLNEHAKKTSGPLLRHIDREVADKVLENPVVWPDSLRQSLEHTMENSNVVLKTRVKSTQIISFEKKDLLFYCALIFLILGYLWFLIGKTELKQ